MNKISVIIPNYNRALLICETIDNMLAQSAPPDEIIVVDDGSTDHSVEVLKSFGDRIHLIQQRNLGPGAARNTGLKHSTGDYIQFFDSDDVMTLNKLEVQSKLLDHEPELDFVYGPYVMATESSDSWNQLDVIMQYFPLPNRPLTEIVASGWCAITQSCLFRRTFIDRVGPWREDLMPHEDKEYWYRIGKVTRRYIHENKTCVFYRQHQLQITDRQVDTIKRTIDGIKAFDLIIDQLKEDRVSSFSSVLCRGIRAGYVRYLNHVGSFAYTYDLKCAFDYNIYRLAQKMGRMLTKTKWQPFNGVLNSSSKFNEYRVMLKAWSK